MASTGTTCLVTGNIRLALKFELVTMLRSAELLAAHRDELFDLDGKIRASMCR